MEREEFKTTLERLKDSVDQIQSNPVFQAIGSMKTIDQRIKEIENNNATLITQIEELKAKILKKELE